MYLKQLDLIGFKSFAERTRLDFEPGITAIVGPNGCGKSNLVEAIKWSLGEQSAKSLRGSSMEDVIFHGTDDRKGIGMAEVSVTFDNSDKKISLEFSEITATRRVFRSGESQYFINKNLCRLKDVDSVFMDTGIGMRAYSVFEQGKMDLILSSRPEERRFVFEEAAGITRYKEHKRETLRKVEVTEANLVRLNDIIKEVQRQLNSIERAASKARRYKNIQEELRSKEVRQLVYQLRGLQEDQLRFEKDRSLDEQQAAKMHEAIDSKDKELSELRQSIREIDSGMSVVQDEKVHVETRLVSCKHESGYKHNKIRELQERSRLIDSELERLNKDLAEFCSSLEAIEKEFSSAGNTKIDCKNRLGEKHNIVRSLEARNGELAGEIDSKKELLVGKTAEQSHIKNELSNIDLELKNLSLKERRDSVELAKKKKEQEELSRKLAKLGNVLEIQRRSLLGVRQKMKDHEERLILLREEISNINRFLNDKQQYFTGKHKEYEMFSNEKRLRSILENKDEFPGVIGLVSDLITAKQGYSVVVDTMANARKAAEVLQAKGEPQTAFLVLESLPDADAIKNVMIGIKDLALDELKVILNNVSSEMLELREKYNLSKGTLEQEEKLLEAARNNLYNEEIALGVEENDFLRYKAMYGSLCEEIQALELDGQGETAEREELNAARSRKEAELESAGSELRLLYSEIEGLQGLLKEVSNNREKEDREYAELKISLVSAEGRENLTEFKKHQIEKQIEAARGMADKFSREKIENHAMIERLTMEAGGLEQEASEVSRRSIDIGQRYESIKENRRRLEEEMAQAEEVLRKEREMYDEVYSQFNERQLRLGEVGIKIDNIMHRLQNEYKTAPDTIDSISLEGVSIEALEQDIVTLRSKLDTMGEVSLVAIEEQDELVKRHEFLSTQREDLVNAKDSLLKTIAKLNATSRKLFWDTFCLIRENFNRIFCQLFDGGKADLILVDESNMLESGIEIIARPPGKRLQNVSLLSGGEKALTALALLFSIFKVKSSPFCIMDEIDAPLDDSNIDRFIELLKEFSQMSQFIIVTHNKRTIAAANALYGITMQESGVSRVVSVRFSTSGAVK